MHADLASDADNVYFYVRHWAAPVAGVHGRGTTV
jgi:hypothetical protein